MFENIGGKIKTLAKVLCWVGIIVSIILAIIMFISAGDASYSEEGLYRGLGFGFLLVAPLLSWISSFLLYGFGELIETNCEIARNTRYNNGQSYNPFKRDSSVNPVVSNTSAKKEQVHTWVGNCDMCDKRDVKISAVKIVDDMGTRYRNVCEECAKRYNCVSDRDVELDNLLKDGLISQEEYDQKKRGL